MVAEKYSEKPSVKTNLEQVINEKQIGWNHESNSRPYRNVGTGDFFVGKLSYRGST